ncbi:hypothetical protein F2P81_007706 [Scophthalmus maximus]|uniref:Uncharacterized protein n=1 Tax=Scophthalmus maximus TaxID=52904 RepID=A0A6A4T8S7_SCOMX|nr:hypothetical protein F2P81_007706 [Scophthalmus maximus]
MDKNQPSTSDTCANGLVLTEWSQCRALDVDSHVGSRRFSGDRHFLLRNTTQRRLDDSPGYMMAPSESRSDKPDDGSYCSQCLHVELYSYHVNEPRPLATSSVQYDAAAHGRLTRRLHSPLRYARHSCRWVERSNQPVLSATFPTELAISSDFVSCTAVVNVSPCRWTVSERKKTRDDLFVDCDQQARCQAG